MANLAVQQLSQRLRVNPKALLYSVALFSLVLCIQFFFIFSQYKGNLFWILWPSETYGVPAELSTKGLKPLFVAEDKGGWDGQFYYYAANDLFIDKDTAEIMDAAAYRYQRIGLPALAKLTSLLSMQAWVSPKIYYFTQSLFVFLGIYLLVYLLLAANMPAVYAMIWPLSIGTLSAYFHGLPDPTADVLLLAALVSYKFARSVWLYAVLMALALLTRELALIPAFLIGVLEVIDQVKSRKWDLYRIFAMLLPGLVFCAWYFYVYVKTGVFPFQQAHGILGLPILAPLKSFYIAVFSFNKGDIIGHFCYFYILLSGFYLLRKSATAHPFLWSLLPILLMLGSFGPTVMESVRDFMKGLSPLLILAPFLLCLVPTRTNRLHFVMSGMLIVSLVTLVGFLALKKKEGEHLRQYYKNKIEVSFTKGF